MVGVDPKSVMSKRKASKEQAKKLKYYALIIVVVAAVAVWFVYAEMEASKQRNWASNYERKCEACQTMIVSGIWTRSMIAQQEMKRIEQEHKESGNTEPLTPEQKSPPIRASVVLRYMCSDQQIDNLLGSYPLTFGDGFTSTEDPDFSGSVKKLCWYAMNNDTVTKTFKKMLETPMTQIQNPTLISVSKVHASSVCVHRIGACSEAQLDPGMVDVPMPQQGRRPEPRTVEEAQTIPGDYSQPGGMDPVEEADQETEL